MNNKVVPLLITLIVLAAINIAVSGYIALRPSSVAPAGGTALVDESIVSEAKAAGLAKSIVESYNANDVAGAYAQLDDLAKAQLSQEQLSTQMQKLHSVLGTIGTYAFDRAESAGTDAGRSFYTISYKAAFSGGSFAHGTLKLTVVRRGDELRLVGFFLNGSDSTVTK